MEASVEYKRVVIVGGGVAGALLARSVEFHADVFLIDPKEYYEIPWANLRAKVEPDFAKRSLINHKDYLRNTRLVTASGVKVTEKEVLTSDGRWILYDYLVIATGHPYSIPLTRLERLQQFQAEYQKLQSADSVLILGGGPTGVELAGEIVVDFPGKQVTIVHRGSRLLDFIGQKASTKVLDWLKAKHVNVLLNQEVKLDELSEGQKTYETSNGTKVSADCCFICTGLPLSTEWLREGVLSECLDRHGRLMVNEHLLVRGKSNVFAIGDITNVPEIKQGFYAQKHAAVVAKNLKALIKGGKKLTDYCPGTTMAMVSLGRREAVAQFPFTTLIGRFPGMIKSKDLFVGKTRKEMGLEDGD
ncbi:hypothetical protein AMTRI_Chr11g95260 [Amborella trichopoda]|uniref:FAD/NAD(P)-binding domain-containing protein n=1 Tax=Amborella trichopoda TaxID=13333 RepID=U5D3X3_AMBTC|nr:apoptosis-inducing factor 2 [Amborella trichopoda]ERN16107.1 hypothetical protein AMTR_s00030p00192180 [Amborella trichopoda]|eukprot:XP_006854640.1 apoptosis-inducing factor 2 [Amborella trichopoda]